MKFNWYQVVVLVLLVVAAVGWAMYADQRDVNQELYSRQPTPPPTGTVYGLFEKLDGDTISVGIQEVGGEAGTLVSTQLRLSADASVLRLDTQANEYVASSISELKAGTWLQLGTDAAGVVISVTAGR